jgi:hypothetical protein
VSLQRKLIRKEAVAILLNQIPAIGARVFSNRRTAIFDSELPLIGVYDDGEPSITTTADGPREYKRTVALKFEIVADDSSETVLEDVLDDIAHALEQIFFRNDTLNKKSTGSRLVKVEKDFSIEGKKVIGACTVTFEIDYYVDAPEAASDNFSAFEEAGVEIDTAPAPDSVPEIEAEIVLPQ